MIVIRNVFIAKPGNASKLAEQFKGAARAAKWENFRVLTDLTGDSNKVVLEFEVESVSEWEKQLKDYKTNTELQSAMKGYTDLYLTANRELLQSM